MKDKLQRRRGVAQREGIEHEGSGASDVIKKKKEKKRNK
jgi:hypothetical protein